MSRPGGGGRQGWRPTSRRDALPASPRTGHASYSPAGERSGPTAPDYGAPSNQPGREETEHEDRGRGREAIAPIEHAAVARQQPPRVLHADIAFRDADRQVAEHRDERGDGADRNERTDWHIDECRGHGGHERGKRDAARDPFPCLAGAHLRRELVPADRSAGKERADVSRPDDRDHG